MNSVFRFIAVMLVLVALILPVQDAAAASRPVGWLPAGAMLAPRTEHGSALLPDGSVLVTGGFGPLVAGGENAGTASAERYDPVTGQWSVIQPMTTVRFGHTLTRMAQELVLAVGGDDAQETGLTSAEIYNPATGQWTLTGSTADAHVEHEAVLLANGRVLVVGGYGPPEGHPDKNTDGFEIYNLATGQWSVPASPPEIIGKLVGLIEHSLVRLADGRVLVIGGRRGTNVSRDVLLFDPASSQWSLASPLMTARTGLAAALLADGRVLVVGGQDSASNYLSSAEIYDPATGQWRAAASMVMPRSGHTATRLLNGQVLVVGGGNGNDYDNDSEVYDPQYDTWQPAGTPMHAYGLHTSTLLLDGSVLVNGGMEDGSVSSAASRFYGPRIFYVDSQAGANGSGTSWGDAFNDLQLALHAALPGDQIWVSAGAYFPTSDPTNREASFVLPPGVEIYGGFSTKYWQTTFEQRDWTFNITRLSGNIDYYESPTGHSYHVVYSDASDGVPSVLDGFWIEDGSADGPIGADGSAANQQGGGIYVHHSQPILRNLVIDGNRARQGGGMFTDSRAQLTNVIFRGNQADDYGGGLANGDGAAQDPQSPQFQAVLTNVTFSGNYADYGAAIANRGVYSLSQPPNATQPDMTQVTFHENNSGSLLGHDLYAFNSDQVINNSILWGTRIRYTVAGSGGSFIFNRDIIYGGCPTNLNAVCSGVSNSNPQLIALDGSARVAQTYGLSPDSPAIDAVPAAECTRMIPTSGSAYSRVPLTFDARGALRPSGAGCDLGAREFNAVMTIISGDNQRADAFQPFPEPLAVSVTSTWGDVMEGKTIHYTMMVSDAGGMISSSTATVANWQASITATARNAPGFSVEASTPGADPVIFHLGVNDSTVALAASPNPAEVGQPVTLTAKVEGRLFGFQPSPSGTVTFKEGDITLGTAALPPADPFGGPAAQTTLTVSNLTVGEHAITAVYSGDSTYHDVTTSPVLPLTIIKKAAAVTLGGLAQTYSGTPRVVTAATSPAGLPVRITYNGAAEPPIKAGSYAVSAEITDPNYTGSATGTLEVAKAMLDVRVTNLSRPYGLPNPPLTYSITGFVNGEGPEVVTGAPVLTCDAVPTSKPGSYTIDISEGTLAAENYWFYKWMNKLYVLKAETTIQWTASPAAPVYGQPVTLTATVSGPEGSVITPSGSMSFSIDAGVASTSVLDANGQAALTISPLATGAHTVQLKFSDGSVNYVDSSVSGTLQVSPAPAAVTLSGLSYKYDGKPHGATVTTDPAGLAYRVTYNGSTALPVKAGSYTVYAAITDPNYSGSATGTLVIQKANVKVQAEDQRRVYGAPNPAIPYHFEGFVEGEDKSVVSGEPVFDPLPALDTPPGDYPVALQTGSLSADNYAFSPVPGTLTIDKAGTLLQLTASPNPALPGQEVTLTATVTSQSGALPEGVHFVGGITFQIGGSSPVTVPMGLDGTAKYSMRAQAPDETVITVEYAGDGNFNGSSGGPVQLVTAQVQLFMPFVGR